MTQTRRILNILMGLVMLAFAAAITLYPQESIPIVLGLIGMGMTIRGFNALLYYFSMAKHMVGGKRLLYRGIIFLDLGLLTSTLAEAPELSLAIYVAAISGYTAIVAMLRAAEEKQGGSPQWMGKFIYGAIYAGMTVAVIVFGIVLKRPETTIYVYAAGLIYGAVTKIAGAFRRTAIVYIQ